MAQQDLSQQERRYICNVFPQWPVSRSGIDNKPVTYFPTVILISPWNISLNAGIIWCAGSSNERKHYIKAPPPIGWAHTRKYPSNVRFIIVQLGSTMSSQWDVADVYVSQLIVIRYVTWMRLTVDAECKWMGLTVILHCFAHCYKYVMLL